MEATENNKKMTSEEFLEAYMNATPKVQKIVRQLLELTEEDVSCSEGQGGTEKV